MARTQFILIRHSETLWNLEGRFQGHLDSALTDIGIAQAKALSERLARFHFTALYSSDLERAYSTAKFIADRHGLVIFTDKRLRERNLGIFEGLHREQIQHEHPEEYRLYKTSGPDYVIPRGESARQRFSRIISYLEELSHKHSGETILIVCHGGVLESLFRHALSIPLSAPRYFKLLNCSLNVFYHEDARWSLRTWGDVAHLESLRVLDDL